MAQGATEVVFVRRVHAPDDVGSDCTTAAEPDHVVVEDPLSIRLDGELVATTMRTPGADAELAVGLCLSSGFLDGRRLDRVKLCADDSNVVEVLTDPLLGVDDHGQKRQATPSRLGVISSSCGLCGSEQIEELWERLGPIDLSDTHDAIAGRGPVDERFGPAVLASVADRLDGQQPVFDLTGGSHAAAVFDLAGQVSTVREDIGRHNAVDKVIGRMYMDSDVPSQDSGLLVSGRASFEIVQKAWAGGLGAVVAVGAASSMAVKAAQRCGMTLAAFARGGSATIITNTMS